MTQYSTISIDKRTKDKAAKRAKFDAIPVSTVVRILLNDYAEGKIMIGSKMNLTENGFTTEFEESVISSDKEQESPAFKNMNDAINYLHKESKKLS